MKQIIKLLLFVVVAISPINISAMRPLTQFITDVIDYRPIDNNGTTNHQYSQDDAIDAIMNTHAAQAWNKGSVSQGLLISEGVIGAIETFSGHDLSNVYDLVYATNNDLISDRHANNNTSQFVGAAFYGAGHIYDANSQRMNDEFLKTHQEEMENDKYFFCRYQINEKTGRYCDVIKEYGQSKYMECVRERQQNEYNTMIEAALLECNLWYTMEDLDSLARGDINQRNKRNMIISEALKCYKSSQSKISEDINEIYVSTQSEQITFENGNNKAITEANEQEQEQEEATTINIVEKPSAKPHVYTDIEVLKQTTVNLYELNSYGLSEENKKALDKVAEILIRNNGMQVVLMGHTCDIGDEKANYDVGILRAKVAKKYLVEKGVDKQRISVQSAGSKLPVVSNDSPANRALNRRVEVIIPE